MAIETGVRRGELAALRPIDVDLEAGEIPRSSRRARCRGRSPAPVRCGPSATTRRTTSTASIRIGDRLGRDVREFLIATDKRGEDLLFGTSTGSPVLRSMFRTREWLPVIEPLGVRQRVRFHDLRGAHASWLLAGGADLKAVMDRLGHEQIQTTQQYLDRIPDADDRALAAFESVRTRHR